MRRAKGFTLIELVMVIILLGIISVGISSVIKFGSQIYSSVTGREALMSGARFAIERLNREVRAALPNSVRVNSSEDPLRPLKPLKQCLEFTPVAASTVYLDIPVAPEPIDDKISVISSDDSDFDSNFNSNLRVATYTLTAEDVYGLNDQIFALLQDPDPDPDPDPKYALNKAELHKWILTLNAEVHFDQDSPTRRLYLIEPPVSYCVHGDQLTRHTGYTRDSDNLPTACTGSTCAASAVLMAEDVNLVASDLPFSVDNATRIRNSLISIKLTFTRDDETISFNNEIQVPNVP